MTFIARHARGIVGAIAILALTAGIALAARPEGAPTAVADDGLERATEVSGLSVPLGGAPEADEPADETEPEADDEDANADTHGGDVSEAARAETPEGFDNHGQYVKSIATDNHGQAVAAEARGAKPETGKPSR